MRRAARIAAWTFGSMLLLVVLLVLATLVAGNTAGGRRLIEQGAARYSGGKLLLTGLAGTFPQAIRLGQLQLRDASGVWLTAQGVSLHWSPLALLARDVKIDQLQLARLDIERRPVTQPSEGGSSSSSAHLDLQQLSIDRLELGPQLAGARVSLSLWATLHYRSPRDATVQVTARRGDGRGDYELTASVDPVRMAANLRLEEPASGPLENLLGYPGLGALSVQATLGGPPNAEQLELNARVGELRAVARGTLDLSRRSADLDYDLDAPAMTPRPDLSWQRLALHGRWHGPLDSAQADARLELTALELPKDAGARAVEATLTADHGDLTLRAEVDGLTLPGREPRLLAQSPLHIEAAMKLSDAQRPLQLEVQHRLFTLQARAVTMGAPSGTFDLHLPDLAPFAAIAGQKIAGRSDVRGAMRQEGATTHLEVEASNELARGPTAVAEWLAGASRLQLSAALTPHSLTVERLALSAPKLSASASGTARRGSGQPASSIQSIHAHYAANIADASTLASSLAGTVSANGTIDGPPGSLAATLRLTSSLSVRGAPRETLEASITARGLPAHASAGIQAGGRLAGAPLELDASLERVAGGAFHLTVQRAEWKSARIGGEVMTGANLTPGHGAIRVHIGQLADLKSLVGTSLGGSLDGSLELRPGRARTYVRARLGAQNLVAANLPADVLLTAEGPTDALGLHLTVRSPNLRGEPASLEAASRFDLDARSLALERIEMHYHGQTLRLLAPARVSFADGLVISKLELGMQRAVMMVDGRLSPTLDIRAFVHHVDPALINAFMPDTLLQGTLDADVRLEGKTSAPAGSITINAAGLRAANAAARDLHALDVRASAQLAGGSAHIDAHLNAGNSSQLVLAGMAPVSGGGSSLDLKLTGKLDAALINPLLEARGQRASGGLAINAAVKGTASAPELSGTVDLTHGELRDYVRGVHLSDMTAHLVGEHGTLRIIRFSARAPPGELSMTGTVGVLQPKLPIQIELLAKDAQPLTSNTVTARLNADIKVTGTLRERMQVSGSIDLQRTMINIPNSLPPDVAVLDVRRPGQEPPPPAESKLVVGLDIRVHAPREILVQGHGLNAELGGDLEVSGSSDKPKVGGGFEMIRGTFALSGTTLTFTQGKLSFNGTGLKGKIDPTLDFTAESFVAGAKVSLHITGFADAPQFELSSDPTLPQDEILARLLFGETASQLTALQVAEIGAALASLSGVGGGGPSPLVKVQKALGLDRLSVGSTNTGATGSQNSGTTVEAGRYVSSRVFVGAKQSTTGFSQAEVDVDLSKHLKLQTRLGNGTATTQGTTPENDPGSSIGLTYQFEY
jgi:translocation and assembly module TamB